MYSFFFVTSVSSLREAFCSLREAFCSLREALCCLGPLLPGPLRGNNVRP